MKRIAGLVVILVSIVGCTSSHRTSTAPTPVSAPTIGRTTATTSPSTCRGCGLPRPTAHAAALCATAFGDTVVESAATNARTVREAGIGVVGGMFKKAFPGVNDGEFAAWCMVATGPGCYDESAVAATGALQHIVSAGCGWRNGPPRAGPPDWTD
jgi:hypothetical protein